MNERAFPVHINCVCAHHLEAPSGFSARQASSGHIEDRIDDTRFDRNKIRVTIHPEQRDEWYWLMPFSNGISSAGAEPAVFDQEIMPLPASANV